MSITSDPNGQNLKNQWDLEAKGIAAVSQGLTTHHQCELYMSVAKLPSRYMYVCFEVWENRQKQNM